MVFLREASQHGVTSKYLEDGMFSLTRFLQPALHNEAVLF
jgi:hypothetical protein